MKGNPTWHKTHPEFQLNGTHYRGNELEELGYGLIKEGTFFETSIGSFLLDWKNPKTVVEVPTSGSTGKPKTITLKKEYMLNSAQATGTYFRLRPGDKALLCLPCSGIAGKMMLVRAMVLGLSLDYVEPSSKPLTEIHKNFDFGAMVPLQVENSMGQLSQIKTLLIGGASVSKNLLKKLRSTPCQVYETYGMTETITHIAAKRVNNNGDDHFKTLPNIKISRDSRNCLIIDAPNISDNKVITNDLVELMGKNEFKWLGRHDSIINSGGIKLIPEQIERKLSALLEGRFFVVGIPDDLLGNKLVLLLENPKLPGPEILERLKTLPTLDKYEIPKEVHVLDAFIETGNGKIQRRKTLEKLSL